jgi:hypothetical protein
VARASSVQQSGGDESTGLAAAWVMIATMVAFKVGLTLYILIAYPSVLNLVMQLVLNVFWWILLVAVVAAGVFLWGPLVRMWTRLVRMRARRAELERAEWIVD